VDATMGTTVDATMGVVEMITAVKEIMEEMLIAGVDTIMTNEVESMKTVLEDIIGILVLLLLQSI
jgi:hypothetical protein